MGVQREVIAVSRESGRIDFWTLDEKNRKWSSKNITVGTPAWKLNWSETGGLLAVTCGEDQSKVYKQDHNGDWVEV